MEKWLKFLISVNTHEMIELKNCEFSLKIFIEDFYNLTTIFFL